MDPFLQDEGIWVCCKWRTCVRASRIPKVAAFGENLPTSVKMHGSFSLVRPDSVRLLILLAWCGRWNLARCYKSVKSREPMQKGAAF